MAEFLFFTTLTPTQFRNPLRDRMADLWKQALLQQTVGDWEVLMIGEEDRQEGRFREVKTSAVTKREKLNAGWEFVERLPEKPAYIIRLDDDDLISPTVLQRAKELDFDCYGDRWHWYYDLVHARFARLKRDFLPNTCIHTYAHAATPYGESDWPLLIHDHSQSWHTYYADKNLTHPDPTDPVYLRILSPSTISAGYAGGGSGEANPVDLKAYAAGISAKGKVWNRQCPEAFQAFSQSLIDVWEEFSGQKIQAPPASPWWKRLFNA